MADPGISESGTYSGAVEFLSSGDCCDAPSHVHIPYVFVMRVENIKYILYALYVDVLCSQTLQKHPPPKKNIQGMHARCIGLGSGFGSRSDIYM